MSSSALIVILKAMWPAFITRAELYSALYKDTVLPCHVHLMSPFVSSRVLSAANKQVAHGI